jgi:UPF0042 nucleotide-binding protein
MSGSGKTAVSRFLEDLGYYCMDNLPAKLITRFVDLWKREEVKLKKVALVVDLREASFTREFPKALNSIRKIISPRLIFLDASDETLIKRFSESRRPHPLTKKGTIKESITLERKRLAKFKNMADEVIDTTSTSINELKTILTRRFVKEKSKKLQVSIKSFGYKYGIPVDADLIFDTRFLPNPFYDEQLREKTGKSKSVRDFVFKSEKTKKFLGELYRFMDFLMPNFVEEGKSYLTIGIGCTGGKHRSVVLAEQLKEYLENLKYSATVEHRDIYL